MKHALTTSLSAAVIAAVTAGWAFAQAGADYEVKCSQALAAQEGVEQTAVEVGTAEEVEGVMRVNLMLEEANWVCTLDDAGEVASLEQEEN
jgi:hypothetical protein